MISAFKHIRLSGNNLTPVQSAVWDGSSSLRLGFGNSGLAYYSELTGISGYLQTLINTATADVNSINGLSGNVNITGSDGITIQVNTGTNEITIVGNSGYFQGLINNLTSDLNLTGTTLSQNLASTGSTLATNLASTGSTLATNLASTGSTLATNLASTGSTLATNLASTGSTLQTNINTLSGYANATFVAKTSNQVFTTNLAPGADAYSINYPVPFGGVTPPKVQATLEVSGDVMYNLSVQSVGFTGYTGLLSDNVLESNVKIHTFASTQ
jgi:hypothetical protein